MDAENPHLSPNFRRSELACPCCGKCELDPDLVPALQEARDRINAPIHVTSGYRCGQHNRRVGGTRHSQHLQGKAADVWFEGGFTVDEMYDILNTVSAFRDGGLGVYPDRGFVHADVRGTRARWGDIGGNTVSVEEALAYARERDGG